MTLCDSFPDDPQLAVRVTPRLRAKIMELLSESCNKLNDEERRELKEDFENSYCADIHTINDDDSQGGYETKQVQVLHYRSLKVVCKHSLFNLKDLTRRAGTGYGGDPMVLSANPAPADIDKPSSGELARRRGYLQHKKQEREYEAMISNITNDRGSHKSESNTCGAVDGKDPNGITSLTEHTSVAIQMIVAPLASFAVTYYAARSSWKAEVSVCMMWGLLVAMAMLVVEGVLFVARASREDLIRKKAIRNQTQWAKGETRGGINVAATVSPRLAMTKKEN